MSRRAVTLLVLAAIVVAGACGSGDDPTLEAPAGQGTTTTASPTSDEAAATTVDTAAASGGFGDDDVEHRSDSYGHLTAIRHAGHDGYYRVVFEFRDGVPGVHLGFTQRPVVEDGSGDEVDVAGDRVLLVEFEPASAVELRGDQAVETYSGPKRLEVEEAPVVEIVRVTDFEASLDWAIGVDDDATFRLTTLDGPPRVVIDVQP